LSGRVLPVMPEAVEKRFIRRGRRALARAVERDDQVLIAAISGPTPKIVIIRLRL